MSKLEDIFSIARVAKADIEELLKDHHYLTGISRGFKSGLIMDYLKMGK